MADLKLARTVLAAGLFMLVLTSGCAGKHEPQPFLAPALEPAVLHFAGTALSGPTGIKSPDTAQAGDTPRVHVTFLALEQMPSAAGQPLGALARLVVADRQSGPILPSPLLTRDTRLLDLKESADPIAAVDALTNARNATIASLNGVLVPGLTATFSVVQPATADSPSIDGQQRRIEVSVRRIAGSSTQFEYALMVDDFPPGTVASEIDRLSTPQGTDAVAASSADAAARPAMQRELALMERDTPGPTDCVAMILPSRFGMAQAIAAIIQVTPALDDDPHRQALAEALGQAAQAADTASRRSRVAPLAIAETPGFAIMIASLGLPDSRRAALAFLSSRATAPLCEDLSLVGDDPTLTAMAQRVQNKMAEFAAAKTPEELGWQLERTCLELFADLADKGKLAPELAAVLTRNLGEAGRETASIQEVLRGSQNRAMLEARVMAENLIYLEDASPASRVRAFDWLLSRNHAPAGYDPLGTPRQRRDALETFRSAATSGGTP